MAVIQFLLIFFLTPPSTQLNDYTLIQEGDKVGLADTQGHVVIEPRYDRLGWSSGTYQPVAKHIGFQEGDKWGLLSLNEQVVRDAAYDVLLPLDESYLLCGKLSIISNRMYYGLLSPSGVEKLDLQYLSLSKSGESLIVSQNGSNGTAFGVIEATGRTLIPIIYKHVQLLNESIWQAIHPDDQVSYYKPDGELITRTDESAFEVLDNGYIEFSSGQRKGLLSPTGDISLRPTFENISSRDDHSVYADHIGAWTAYTKEKNKAFSRTATNLQPLASKLIFSPAEDGGKLINAVGRELGPQRYTSVIALDSLHFLTQTDSGYGILKLDGRELFPNRYESIRYTGPYFYVKDSTWHVYNKFGRKLSDSGYEDIIASGTILIPAKQNGAWGYLDFNGKTAIPFTYQLVTPFFQERAIATFEGKQGIINTFGQWIIPPAYDGIEIINKGLYLTREAERKALLDDRNKVVFETYNRLDKHPFGLVESNTNGKKGLINKAGTPLHPLKYDSISNLLDRQYYILISEGFYSMIDKNGKTIIPEYSQFEMIFPFDDEFIGMKKEGRYGYMDRSGTLRIANQYQMVGTWSENRGPVKIKGRWGFVDRLERLVCQPYYDEVWPYQDSVSIARIEDRYGLLDYDGNEVLAFDYSQIMRFPSGLYLLKKEGEYGLAGKDGRVSLYTTYDEIQELAHGLYKVKRNGKWGIKNQFNVDLLPTSYVDVDYDPYNQLLLRKEAGKRIVVDLNQ